MAAGAAVKATALEPVMLAAEEPAGRRKIRFASIGTGDIAAAICCARRESCPMPIW